MLYQNITLIPGSAVDAEACVYFRAREGSDVQSITGQIYGPHCEFGKTLASTFVVETLAGEEGQACLARALVLDPCCWTPEMPFLYDLELTTTATPGEVTTYKTSLGLRRWSANGPDWNLETRRVVLRGAVSADVSDETLAKARFAETPLLVTMPGEETLVSASRLGVPLLVDLRDAGEALGDVLQQLTWHPAAFGALLTQRQLLSLSGAKYAGLPLGAAIDALEAVDSLTDLACDFYVTMLTADERPFVWLSKIGKPVMAVRQGEVYADLIAARAGCDQLQAELAPEFNLAGYFVG